MNTYKAGAVAIAIMMMAAAVSADVPPGSVFNGAERSGGEVHTPLGEQGEWISDITEREKPVKAVRANATVRRNATITLEVIDGNRVAGSSTHTLRSGSHEYAIDTETAGMKVRTVITMSGPATIEDVAYVDGKTPVEAAVAAVNGIAIAFLAAIVSVAGLVWWRKRKNVIGERWKPDDVKI